MAPKTAQLADYQYSLYRDYLEQLDGILTKYGQQTGLSIEYWHIRVDESKNYDDLKMQNSYKHYVYDLYHFVPTINMTPLTYQIGYNPQYQGTSNIASGSFSMFLLDKPLPGDLFRFYPYDGTTDRTEIFRITNVQYMRTSKEMLDLYQLEFETAPIYVETLEHVRINEIHCWDAERAIFLDEEQCSGMECIMECRDKIVDAINNWYDEQNGWYGLCKEGGSGIDWEALCGPKKQPKDLIDGNPDNNCPDGPNFPEPPGWPIGPGWPGWPDGGWPTDPNTGLPIPPDKSCGGGSTTKPLVFLNTILKRLKKIFEDLDLKPIWGIGTAKIPIEWIIPYYTMPDPNNPEEDITYSRDYWDTFTCLSYQPDANEGELFNLVKILNGECDKCPQELIDEIECHRELYLLVMSLVLLLSSVLSEEQLKDKTCDRKCCDKFDPEFIGKCITQASQPSEFNLFWDVDGSGAGNNAPNNNEKFENYVDVPLYLTFRDGAIWPNGMQGGSSEKNSTTRHK